MRRLLRAVTVLSLITLAGCGAPSSSEEEATSEEAALGEATETGARGWGWFDPTTCSVHGRRLYGRVQLVDRFGDVRVEVVRFFSDLRVQKVRAFAHRCGEWQIVDRFPDLRVEIVQGLGDVKIEWVSGLPGPS